LELLQIYATINPRKSSLFQGRAAFSARMGRIAPEERSAEIKERRNMAYSINDSCVSCGTCAGECPVSAISEGDGKYVIDADSCISCGTCAGACPVGAIEEG